MKPAILIVDDDKLALEQCVDMLVDLNADIFLATSGKEALEVVNNRKIDVIALDLVLPDLTGDIVMENVKMRSPNTDVIIMSAFATVESVIKLMRKGIFDYIKKPIVAEEFRFIILKCLREREIIEENKKLKEYITIYDLGKMLTSTLELSKVYDNILLLFENFLKDSYVVVINNDVGLDSEIKAFKGFERNEIIAIKDDLINFGSSADRGACEEVLSGEILIYSLSSLKQFSSVNKEKLIVIPIEKSGEVKGHILVFVDSIPEEKKEVLGFVKDQINLALENSLRYLNAQEMAYIDELTKVYNIRYLYVALDNEIKRSERFGTFLSVLFIDLDHFKNVNDKYGHLIGSKLLIEIATEIKKSVRGIDIVVRYGGDEFVVICTETGVELATKVAERIRKRIEEKVFFQEEGLNIKITASIGVATYPVHGLLKTELIDLADKAMYKGKELSRNIVVVTERKAKGDTVSKRV
ncbi:MAG: diguanylate cyclase [bacterium]